MGYYTRFEVKITPMPEDAETLMSQRSGYSGWYTTKDGLLCLDEAKWYDFDEDMLALSTNMPKTLFEVQGYGEENGDLWKAWAFGAELHRSNAKMTYEEPDWLEAAIAVANDDEAQEAIRKEEEERAQLRALMEKYPDEVSK